MFCDEKMNQVTFACCLNEEKKMTNRETAAGTAGRWGAAVALCVAALLLAEWTKPMGLMPPTGRRAALLVIPLLGCLMACSVRSMWGALISLVFLTLQWAGVVHLQYFGTYFRRRDFLVLGDELSDVVQGLAGTLDAWGLSLLGMAGSVGLLACARFIAPRGSRLGVLSLVTLLVLPAALAFYLPAWRMEPDDRRPALVNALYAWGGFLADTAMPSSHASVGRWRSYQAQPVFEVPEPPSILVIMGESLNPDHMSVTGGARDTTPALRRLLATHQGAAGRLITAGVSTRVALPMFFNVVREPDHPAAHRRSPVNLFRVARARGMQTAFLSVQEMGGLSSVIGREAMDQWVDALGQPLPSGLPDEDLARRAERGGVDWARPYFVVLNTRSAHIPYKANFPPAFARFAREPAETRLQQTINEYDDAIRYFDAKVTPVVHEIVARSKGQVLVIIMSDHGEVVGTGGRFGHNMFLPEVFQIPFVWLLKEPDERLAQVLSQPCMVNQYELGKRLLLLLGVRHHNPDELLPEPGTYWVNGNQLDGANGVFRYNRAALPVDVGCPR